MSKKNKNKNKARSNYSDCYVIDIHVDDEAHSSSCYEDSAEVDNNSNDIDEKQSNENHLAISGALNIKCSDDKCSNSGSLSGDEYNDTVIDDESNNSDCCGENQVHESCDGNSLLNDSLFNIYINGNFVDSNYGYDNQDSDVTEIASPPDNGCYTILINGGSSNPDYSDNNQDDETMESSSSPGDRCYTILINGSSCSPDCSDNNQDTEAIESGSSHGDGCYIIPINGPDCSDNNQNDEIMESSSSPGDGCYTIPINGGASSPDCCEEEQHTETCKDTSSPDDGPYHFIINGGSDGSPYGESVFDDELPVETSLSNKKEYTSTVPTCTVSSLVDIFPGDTTAKNNLGNNILLWDEDCSDLNLDNSIHNSEADPPSHSEEETQVGQLHLREDDIFDLGNIIEVKDESKTKMDKPQNARPANAVSSSANTKLTEYDIIDRLFQQYDFRNLGGDMENPGQLYLFIDPVFTVIKECGLTEIIRTILTPEELRSVSPYIYKTVYKLMHTYSHIKIDEIPIYPELAAFKNGLFNVKTGRKIPSTPDIFILNQIQARYMPGAYLPTPEFDRFLAACSGGDPEIEELIVAFIGYCVSNDRRGKAIFVLGPAPDSGKSVLGNLLIYLVGRKFVSNMYLHDMGETFSLESLVNKHLNIAMDLPPNEIKEKAISVIKSTSGNDRIDVNQKFKAITSERIRAAYIFGTNSPLKARSDTAFWNRVRIIPMNHSVPEDKRDPQLLDKLKKEADGIITQAMEAYQTLVKNRYQFPYSETAEKMKKRWSGLDPYGIQEFLEEKCDLSDPDARTHTEVLYNCYKQFCDENGLSPTSEKQFSMVLKGTHGLKNNRWKEVHNRNSQYGFYGIQLKEDPAIDHDTVIIS